MLTIILIIALLLFLAVTFNVPSKLNLTAAGLAAVTLYLLLSAGLL